ncbi:hypothetical protein B0H11DRAFT_2270018 [Mycena galericulata]|nr:hypothetical protein B0H11DRAFT_2270018 [Mycena galericulata]
MRLDTFCLRFRLSEIDAQLAQIENSYRPSYQQVISGLKKERQRRLLEEQKAIQESLDRIVYPILTIPVEITSEIFLRCLPDQPTQPSARVAPLLLSAICQQWRYIALGDPRLWAVLKIHIPARCFRNYNADMVQEWLLRAGNMPLSICLVLRDARYGCFEPFSSDGSAISLCPVPSSLFTDSWERLTSFRGDFLTLFEYLELLRLASKLVRCEFCRFREPCDSVRSDFPTLQLPSLQSLTLTSRDYFEDDPITMLLDFLTLPNLQSFKVICFSLPFCEPSFHSFLQRAPNIHNFTARVEDDDYWGDIDDAAVTPIFNALSSLTTLTLHTDFEDPVFAILRLLNTSETSLPRVETMTFSVRCDFDRCYDAAYEYTRILVGALTSRSEPRSGVAQLTDFRFDLSSSFNWLDDEDEDDDHEDEDDDRDPPATPLIAKLRVLKERGMNIHFGAPDASWV